MEATETLAQIIFDLRSKWNRGSEVSGLLDFSMPLSFIALTSFNHLSIDSG
jgi:hypothetical protein